jgi:hypothetical protein
MKTTCFLIVLVCCTQLISAQTLKIYKTDQSTISFNLADVDSIRITTSASGSNNMILGWNKTPSTSDKSVVGLKQENSRETIVERKIYTDETSNCYKTPAHIVEQNGTSYYVACAKKIIR